MPTVVPLDGPPDGGMCSNVAYEIAIDSGMSSVAQELNAIFTQYLEYIERPLSLSGPRQSAIEQIQEILRECRRPNWDGYGARPVQPLTASNARLLIRMLPASCPMPEVAPEPDGSISLDWIQGPNRMLSISVGVTERLACAWIDGADSGREVVSWSRLLSSHIMRLIQTYGVKRNARFRTA